MLSSSVKSHVSVGESVPTTHAHYRYPAVTKKRNL